MKSTLLTLMLSAVTASGISAQNIFTDSLEFDKSAAISVDQLLVGRVSGVNVLPTDGGLNSLRNMYIRGVNTLHGSSTPLIIIDGAILTNVQDEQIDMFWQDKYAGMASDQQLTSICGINLYDIESIKVLKNVSATAMYGGLGANGAIIINTKRRSEGKGIELRSNFGTSFPGFLNNNSVALTSGNKRTDYRFSVFFRGMQSSPLIETNNYGGAAFSLNTKAGTRVDLGLSSRTSIGGLCSVPATLKGTDYEDLADNLRTTNSFYFNFRILEGFYWRTNLSVDYQVNSRSIWYGIDTDFGKAMNKAAGISVASKLFADARTSLDYTCSLVRNHSFGASVGAEVYYSDTKFNTLNGTDILVSQLKSLGFGYRGSGDDAALYRKSLPQYGLYGKLFYNYKNYAGVELLTRFDRTFRYEDEWKMYPSATVFVDFWEIFLRDSKTLSTLRIEGGYGKAGLNRYVPYYMFRKFTSEPVPSYPKEAQTFAEGWQDVECEEFNVGVKAGFLDDRLNLSAVFYSRKSDDLLSLFSFGTLDETDQLWKYTSRAVAAEYVGHISNMGVEIDFNGTLISRRNFRWNMGMNFAYNKMSTEFDFPAFMGGLSTTAHFYGVTADLLLDSYRPSRISLGYNIPVSKIKWIDNMSVYATASNIFMRTLVFGIKADF